MTVLINANMVILQGDVVLGYTLNIVAILTCITVLMIRIMIHAAKESQERRWSQALDTVMYPLVVLCVTVIIQRLLSILPMTP